MKKMLNILLNGEKAFTKDGVMMTNDYNNEKSSKDVRENIIKEYLCSKCVVVNDVRPNL